MRATSGAAAGQGQSDFGSALAALVLLGCQCQFAADALENHSRPGSGCQLKPSSASFLAESSQQQFYRSDSWRHRRSYLMVS